MHSKRNSPQSLSYSRDDSLDYLHCLVHFTTCFEQELSVLIVKQIIPQYCTIREQHVFDYKLNNEKKS